HWRPASPMVEPGGACAIATADDGRVLVAGGLFGREAVPAVSSLDYDVARDSWSPGPALLSPRVLHTQAKLPNGDVLLIGGQHAASNTAERYDARRGVFEYAGTLAVPRMVADAAALPDGRAIVPAGPSLPPGPAPFHPSAAR